MTFHLPKRSRNNRRGFTLIELLVVIGIIVTLAALTIGAVNLSFSTDRVAGSSRQLQSFLEGARDRAIFAKAPRGVRFTIERSELGEIYARSMVYVGAPEPVYGTLRIGPDGRTAIQASGTPWTQLWTDGLLFRGAKIQIGKSPTAGDPENELTANDFIFTFDDVTFVQSPPSGPGLNQTILPFVHPEWPTGSGISAVPYKLSLAPGVLAGQKPAELSDGVVIDIFKSKFPDAWKLNPNNLRTFDVMFSPRGTVTGPAASNGILHFAVRDLVDFSRPLGSHLNEGDEAIVTIFTRTGTITTSPVFNEMTDDANGDGVPEGWTDIDGDGAPDGPADNPTVIASGHSDPYYYAETGQEARK